METKTARLRRVLGNLRSSFDALADAQLLNRFIVGRDEAAFAALVRRHGPLVLGVCRRLLRHTQDAEDAFQVTFLLLARKAGSVRKGEALGGWLYRVAYRTAQEARAMRARRQAQEKQMHELPEPEAEAVEPQDWRALLDDELSRLPEKYQTPIVLCDLEARPRKEVAQLLGIPEGTLSSRLANGRKLLAARLARRGVTLAGGALAAALSQSVLSAHVPGPLVAGTAKAAALLAAGQLAAVSTPVAVLMKGVMQTMFMAKLRTVVGLLVAAVFTCSLGGVAYQTVGAQNPGPPGQKAVKPHDELEALRKENELLKLNLQVVLEKVRAQEAELRTLKEKVAGKSARVDATLLSELLNERNFDTSTTMKVKINVGVPAAPINVGVPAAPSVEDAWKTLQGATNDAEKRHAAEVLQQAVQRLVIKLNESPYNAPLAK